MGVMLLGALALRWPPPTWAHFDEVAFVVIPLGFWGGDLNPHFFNYPTLHFYLCSLLYYLKYLVTSTGTAEQFLVWRYFVNSADLLGLARALQVVFSLATVLVTAAIGRRLYGVAGGLAAGLLMALAPINVRFACIASTDGPAAAWATLAVFLAVRLLQEGRQRDLVWAGVAAGLAGATKYPAALAVLPVAVAALLRVPGLWQRGLWLALGAAVLTFALVSPFVWLDPLGFWRDLSQMGRDHLLAAHLSEPAWLFHLGNSLWHGVGIAGTLAIGLALARRPRWWRPEEKVLLAGILALSLPLLVGSSVFMRYALPVVPLLAVLAARTITSARRPLLRWGVVALVAVEPLYASLQTHQLLGGSDTRLQANRWLTAHFPAGGRLIGIPGACGALEVLTPQQVVIRQTHFLRSFGASGLHRAYSQLAAAPELPPLYLELGADRPSVRSRLEPAAGDSAVGAAVVWCRHPVCSGGEGMAEGDPLAAAVVWQEGYSPGKPEAARWDPLDWYFLPIAGFGQVQSTGPDIRLGTVSLRGSPAEVRAQDLFRALDAVVAGDEAFAVKDWEGAARTYRRVLSAAAAPPELLSPPVAQHLFAQLGRAEGALGHAAESVQALEQAAMIGSVGPELYNDLGLAQAAAGRLGAAAKVWERCVEAYPGFAPAYFNLGQSMAASGRLARAREYWRRGLELMPNHPMAGKLRSVMGGD
ncbi:MAG: glycosyltransferase family 39 protein [Candidatus Latescibacteria bacterium]|nr:glycosyltransferase family 39 protein [Candidatus Latescibacterota bacterium]